MIWKLREKSVHQQHQRKKGVSSWHRKWTICFSVDRIGSVGHLAWGNWEGNVCVCLYVYSHCLIVISTSSASNRGDLLRMPPVTTSVQDLMMTNVYGDDDDRLLRWWWWWAFICFFRWTAALAMMAPRYRSFCLGFFSRFLWLFHNFYCGIHFTNSFLSAPPGTWEINVSTSFRTETSAQTNN